MYTILLTLASVAFSYPYAQYGRPVNAYNEPILRNEYPYYAMNMMNQASSQQQGGGMGGMMGLLDAYLPGFFSSPARVGQTMGMFGLDYSDFNDLFEGARKGDYEKVYGKIFDGKSDFPFMPMASQMFGGMGGAGMGGAGATGTGSTAGAGASSFSPYMYGMIDLQKARAPVRPVNTRLSATRGMPYPMMGMMGGMGGQGQAGMPMAGFLNAMNDVFQNPQAMSYMQMVLDGSDMADIQEAMTHGDVFKLYRKTMGKGFNPFMFSKQAQGGATGTGSASASAPTSPFGGFMPSDGSTQNPYFWNFIDV